MTEMKRLVIQARLLGLDKNATKRGRENEYAVDVVLSDESQYTMFRNLKEIVNFHTKLMNKFKVEAGYFKKEERVIPECPIKQTIFGPQRSIRDDKSFGRLLNYYIKEIPALPAAVVKSELVTEFFSLRASDLDAPEEGSKAGQRRKKRDKIELTDDSLITGPLSLKSYSTVADFMDKKTKFSFKEGATVQVIQKDPSGWWMIDAQGLIGWAPASYLMPVDDTDLKEEKEENETLIEQERVGTRYISISAYQASRDDELSFVRGAVVKVLKKYVDGWWCVRYNGGEGFVPGAMFRKFDKRQATLYVKKIKRNFTSRGTTRIVPTVKPQWMNSRYDARRPAQKSLMSALAQVQDTLQIPRPAATESPSPAVEHPRLVVQQTQEATSSKTDKVPDTLPSSSTAYIAMEQYEGNGIHIQEDDEVAVMDSSDNEWWYVADSKGAEGWAPANYLQPKKNGTDADSTPTVTPEHLALNNSLNETESMIEDEIFDDLDDDAVDSLDVEDCYVVLSDYTKNNIDELDLFEGQVVCVIDDSDKDVWYVNADGQEGWVPSDILQLLTEEDTESSRESTPNDMLSNEASAENSEMSDDALENNGRTRMKRRNHVSRKNKHYEMDLAPSPRSRSIVLSKSPSPSRGNSIASSSQMPQTPPQRSRLHLSDGSDSDPVTNGRHMEKVVVMIGDKTIAELERELREADRLATEARLKAQALKERLELAKQAI